MRETDLKTPIRIGISMCLLGERVRHDGGHKHDHFLTGTLGQYFEWVPVCPEVELGMGTPREPIHLLQVASAAEAGAAEDPAHPVRLVGIRSGVDHTAAMWNFSRRRVTELETQDICGYILKKDSPSCGMERVRVYHLKGPATRNGQGLFARALLEQMPLLPVEEEGRLCDPRLRENWIERVFAYRRLKDLWATRWKLGDLVAFHTAHKLTLLAHEPQAYKSLGQLVAHAKTLARTELRELYSTEFMKALRTVATRGRHTNVLQHILGYFRDHLDKDSQRELAQHIADYRSGIVPLIVPLTLIAHYVRQFGIEYLAGQVYLNPHPRELSLRNHV